MTHNLDLHFFTSEQLKVHDLDIATKVHQATVASVMRRVKHMNSGQILNASRENGRVMLWPQEKIEIVLKHIGEFIFRSAMFSPEARLLSLEGLAK